MQISLLPKHEMKYIWTCDEGISPNSALGWQHILSHIMTKISHNLEISRFAQWHANISWVLPGKLCSFFFMYKRRWLVMKLIWKQNNLLGQFLLWSGVGDQLLQLPITFTISFWIASNTVNVSNHDSHTQLICCTICFLFVVCRIYSKDLFHSAFIYNKGKKNFSHI